MSDISVSIIIPIFNVERYLEQCMNSVLRQTLKNIEIICVDDGSTDNCPAVLAEYQRRDKRIRVISQENSGYGRAINAGIAAAMGEFIGIVEPDDYILPDMYKTLYNCAKKNDCEIVKSDFFRFTGAGKNLKKTYWHIAKEQHNYNRVIDPKKEKVCFRFVMNTWCGIYKREFLQNNNINHNETPGASFQDNGFWFKGFCCANRIYFLDKAFYMNRRDNPDSSIANKEKVYCGNVEYRLIYEWLCDNPSVKKDFIDVFMMKKLHTYMFNLRRIAPRFRYEYIQKFSEEFKEAREKEELVKGVFTPKEWTELNLLINDYNEYFYTVERNRIKVSVILPVYNCERYLRQCLDSLVLQTLKDIEIICINDGSDDNSAEILAEYAARDGRFVIINTENGGAGKARNIGIKAACGKYLYFPDSDDWLESNALSMVYRIAENDKADITVFRSMQYDNETGTVSPCTYSLRLEVLPEFRPFGVQDIGQSVFRNIMGWAWDKLYLRSFITTNELYFQEQRTTNDMYFVYLSLFKATGISVCDNFLYYQRRNVSGSLSTTREKSWECFYNALCKVRNELVDMGIFEKYKADYVDYALHSCLWNLNSLSENVGVKLFDKLRNEWFKELGIVDAPQEWFLYKDEYKQYQEIMKAENEYLSFKLVRIKFENSELKRRLEAKIAMPSVSNTVSLQEAEFWRNSLEATRNSLSFKVGRAITWLPRKILRK